MWVVTGAPSLLFEMADRALAFGIFGGVSGLAFSVTLLIAGRHRTLREMSLPRFTALGAVAVFILYSVLGVSGGFGPVSSLGDLLDLVGTAAAFSILGGGAAAGMLVIAKTADSGLEPMERVKELREDGSS